MVRSIASRVAAGVVTPALASALWVVAWSGYHNEALPSAHDIGKILLFAALWGGPFGIVAMLAIRLRRMWLSIPILACAAAVGIEVQLILIAWLSDRCNECAAWNLEIWSVPALFATITALLLKRHWAFR